MVGYFNPLRRKFGLFALAIACVFMTGWIRSFHSAEILVIPTGDRWFDAIISAEGLLIWADINERSMGRLDWIQQPHSEFHQLFQIDWRLKWCGFQIGEFAEFRNAGRIWAVAYPWMVIPLTLLSAWQLLSKPRATHQLAPPTNATE